MKLRAPLAAVIVAGSVFALGITSQTTVAVGGEEVRVLRRLVQGGEGDGLDDLASTELHVGVAEALASCASWDVREVCCPAGCAAKKGTQWPRADAILRACMAGLGCTESQTKGATVFMKCDCG